MRHPLLIVLLFLSCACSSSADEFYRPEDAVSLFSDSRLTSEEKRKVSVLYARAGESVKRGEYESAERALLDAIRISPDTAALYHSLGLTYVHMNDMFAATHYFEEAISKDPDEFKSVYALAKMKAMDGDNRSAAEYYERSIRLNPDSRSTYHDLANLYYNSGEWSKALEVLQRIKDMGNADKHTLTLLGVTAIRADRADVALESITDLKAMGEVDRARKLELTMLQKRRPE